MAGNARDPHLRLASGERGDVQGEGLIGGNENGLRRVKIAAATASGDLREEGVPTGRKVGRRESDQGGVRIDQVGGGDAGGIDGRQEGFV